MNGIQHSGRLGEEVVAGLIGRDDPVLRAHHHRRSIQIIEAQLGDMLCYVVEEGVSHAGIAGQQDLSGLSHGLRNLRVVQSTRKWRLMTSASIPYFSLSSFTASIAR